jgi:hypothetical protein
MSTSTRSTIVSALRHCGTRTQNGQRVFGQRGLGQSLALAMSAFYQMAPEISRRGNGEHAWNRTASTTNPLFQLRQYGLYLSVKHCGRVLEIHHYILRHCLPMEPKLPDADVQHAVSSADSQVYSTSVQGPKIPPACACQQMLGAFLLQLREMGWPHRRRGSRTKLVVVEWNRTLRLNDGARGPIRHSQRLLQLSQLAKVCRAWYIVPNRLS